MFRTCIVISALAWCAAANAEKAVLECTGDTWVARGDAAPHGRERTLELRKDGAVLLSFRTQAVAGWRIGKATLLLHVAEGRAPEEVRAGPIAAEWSETSAVWGRPSLPHGRTYGVREYGEGWVAVDLDAAALGARGVAVMGSGVRFGARESVGQAPYLLVEGAAR